MQLELQLHVTTYFQKLTFHLLCIWHWIDPFVNKIWSGMFLFSYLMSFHSIVFSILFLLYCLTLLYCLVFFFIIIAFYDMLISVCKDVIQTFLLRFNMFNVLDIFWLISMIYILLHNLLRMSRTVIKFNHWSQQ